MTTAASAQRLLSHLPAIYREDELIGRFLRAFEEVLADLEQKIEAVDTFLDPALAREDFLPWLSSWVAFTLRAHLTPTELSDFLSRVVPLYRRRGTRQNLQDLLRIFTKGEPTVEESANQPNHFKVTVRLPTGSPEAHQRQGVIARALIELERPAHTSYDMELLFPSMQIGKSSQIGVDTLIGTGPDT
jgi:phage tail-like protein